MADELESDFAAEGAGEGAPGSGSASPTEAKPAAAAPEAGAEGAPAPAAAKPSAAAPAPEAGAEGAPAPAAAKPSAAAPAPEAGAEGAPAPAAAKPSAAAPAPEAGAEGAPAPAAAKPSAAAPSGQPTPAATPAEQAAERGKVADAIMASLADSDLPAPTDEDPKATVKVAEFVKEYPQIATLVGSAVAAAVKHVEAKFAPVLSAYQSSAETAARETLIGELLKPGEDGKPLVPEARELVDDPAYWKLIDEKAPKAIKQAADSSDPESIRIAVDWARSKGWSAPSARKGARQDRRAVEIAEGGSVLRPGAGSPAADDEASLRKDFSEEVKD